jgi:Family of unknown function (DUF6158)
MTMGVPADQLSDEDLRRELLQLTKKQDDIEREGTEDQKANHARRSGELAAEFGRRFPAEEIPA